MKKNRKIITAVARDPKTRKRLMADLLVRMELAATRGSASWLIRPSVFDYELQDSFVVAADNFNFRQSPYTTQRLYELAVAGMPVLVGCTRIPPEYEFITERYTEEDLAR